MNWLRKALAVGSIALTFTMQGGLGLCAAPAKNIQVGANPLPIQVEGKTDLPGNFYLSFVRNRNIVMLDGKGKVVWSKHEEQPKEGKATGWWDFKKHKVHGKTYYSYHDETGKDDNYGMQGYAPGERVILDDKFHEIKRIRFEESSVTQKGDPVDGHDFLMLDPDHYILSGYLHGTAYNVPGYPEGSQVVYSYLQEVDHGKVVWDWKSIDYPELYGLTVTDSKKTAADFGNKETNVPDYIHFNAMQLDKDGNLICSFRHLSTMICLDRHKRENQILWKLSGRGDEFGLTEEQKSSCQHYVTVDGDYLTVFDNNNRGKMTRIQSYSIDIPGRKLRAVRSYSFPDKFSFACGSVQHLSDDLYVIGWGWATKGNECMSVYDMKQGKKLMSVSLRDPKDITYRCVYFE